jgi:serine phosphatase RsbU (regulator of sigma subunit)
MKQLSATLQSWLKRPILAGIITVLSLSAIMFVDSITGPTANLSILYFVPITYAAWSLGRLAAYTCAFLADIPHYADQFILAMREHHSIATAVINIIVRLLVYVFVAEVTLRLLASRAEAKQTAQELAIANQDLQNAYSQLDEDIRAAGMLQASMLIPTPISVPGCEIGVNIMYAGMTGGDFADAGTIDGRVYACVADIAGKGTPAALFTTLLKYILTENIRRGAKGADVVNRVNSALSRVLPPEKFVTLFYVEIDPATGIVEYVNAGHIEGLVYRPGTDVIQEVPATTSLLGYRELQTVASVSSLRLDPGDTLVLYTDGAVESKTNSGERIGKEFLRQTIRHHANKPAQEMAETIAAEIKAKTDPVYRDDMVILCIKFTGR